MRLRLTIDGPELRCGWCGDWLPITSEFWVVTTKNRWGRCKACENERARLYQRLRQRDAEYRTKKAGYSRRYRAWLKQVAPEYLPAYDRERRGRERKRAQGYRDKAKGEAA